MDHGPVRAAINSMESAKRKWLFRIIGVVALAAAVFYLWRAFAGYGVAFTEIADQDAEFYGLIGGAAVFYAASLLLLGWAWIAFLIPPALPAQRFKLLRLYGLSSAAKYLPGGVLHFGGRQWGGAQLGLSHRSLAAATIMEAGASVFAAFLLAVLLCAGGYLTMAPAAALALAGVMLGGARRHDAPLSVIRGAGLVLLFMTVMAGLVMGCAVLAGSESALPALAGAYLIAWAAGFIIPGLSAGLGVREAVFILLASGGEPAPDLVAITLFMRVLTTAGDGLFFAGFLAFDRKGPRLVKELSSIDC